MRPVDLHQDVIPFLRSRGSGPLTDLAPIAQGDWSQAFRYRQAGAERVVRFSTLREDFAKDQWAHRWQSEALPIPPQLEIGEALGGYYAIAEYVPGGYLDHLDADQLRAVLPSLFAALDAMRVADLTGSAGYGIWNAEGVAPQTSWAQALLDVANDPATHRLHGWWERLGGSPSGAQPFQEGLTRLQGLLPYLSIERSLVHSDLLHYNVLVVGDRVSAVLDWGCSLFGDFLYDLAWLDFWAPWFPAWASLDFLHEGQRYYEAQGLTIPHWAERIWACELHIGLASQAYQAYRGYRTDLAATAQRTLALTLPPP